MVIAPKKTITKIDIYTNKDTLLDKSHVTCKILGFHTLGVFKLG